MGEQRNKRPTPGGTYSSQHNPSFASNTANEREQRDKINESGLERKSIHGISFSSGSSIAQDKRNDPGSGDRAFSHQVYQEETASELAVPPRITGGLASRSERYRDSSERRASGAIIGMSALALSILSLFFMPIILGITGMVLGFIGRARGSASLGGWAIGLGALSVIAAFFILPFF
ncbi:hypothetical protein [Peribacillus sp. SCS-155]|uniref:hypothetical protein n=1 Tax=Peribacillus sedimenti TaxID=3115297 RepID=UPI0039069290